MGCGSSKTQTLGPQETSKHSASHKGEVQRQSGSVRGAVSKQDEQKAVQPRYEEVRSSCCTGNNPSVQTYQFGPRCNVAHRSGDQGRHMHVSHASL